MARVAAKKRSFMSAALWHHIPNTMSDTFVSATCDIEIRTNLEAA
jgi:hypothetical protein